MSLTALWFLIRNNKYVNAFMAFIMGVIFIVILISGFKTWLAIHDASIAREARRGYVTQITLEAIQAKLNEKERQRIAAVTALDEYKTKTASAIKARDEANAKLEQAIKADTSDGCTWDTNDLNWLRNH